MIIGLGHTPYQLTAQNNDPGLSAQPAHCLLQNAAFQFMTNSIPSHSRPILLNAPYQTNRSLLYHTNPSKTHLHIFPSSGYPYIMLPHPSNNELTLGRVYTRDTHLSHLYVQHFILVTDPIEGHKLKNTNRNLSAKGASKYSPTHTASAIRQCPGCIKKDDDA